MIIAVDGHSSTGKSTIAKKIARKLGYIHIDTGAMYRAVTLYALRNNLIQDQEVENSKLIEDLSKIQLQFHFNKNTGVNEMYLNDEKVEDEIRGMRVSQHVSTIAKIPEVRSFLVDQQRGMAKKQDLVMDGRDIGTVVFPGADLKLFICTDPKIRAERRHKELLDSGIEVSFEEVEKNILDRDYQDTTRADSPLRKAEDAIEIDNSHNTPEETLQEVLTILSHKNIYPKSSH